MANRSVLTCIFSLLGIATGIFAFYAITSIESNLHLVEFGFTAAGDQATSLAFRKIIPDVFIQCWAFGALIASFCSLAVFIGWLAKRTKTISIIVTPLIIIAGFYLFVWFFYFNNYEELFRCFAILLAPCLFALMASIFGIVRNCDSD